MFSYRHAFHAGNHADVLKHATLVAILNHLLEKDAALMVVDTHAGAGLYRLDGDYAETSGESIEGYKKLIQSQLQSQNVAKLPAKNIPKIEVVAGVSLASVAAKNVAKSTRITKTIAPTVLAPLLRNINNRLHALRMRDFIDPGRIVATYEQHSAILRALLKRDGRLAAALLRAHIWQSYDFVCASLSRSGAAR